MLKPAKNLGIISLPLSSILALSLIIISGTPPIEYRHLYRFFNCDGVFYILKISHYDGVVNEEEVFVLGYAFSVLNAIKCSIIKYNFC